VKKKKPAPKKVPIKRKARKEVELERLLDMALETASRGSKEPDIPPIRAPRELLLLRDVSPVFVAIIASWFQDMSPRSAVSRSYELIHEALLAQPWFGMKESFEDTVAIYQKASSSRSEAEHEKTQRLKKLPRKIIDEKVAPLDFEEVMSNLMPHDKKTIRVARFTRWLKEKDIPLRLWKNRKHKGEVQLENSDAEDQVKSFISGGMPYEIYEEAWKKLDAWWKMEKRSIRSSAGKAGGRPKGKQGHVIKKDDKRIGARPPGGGTLKNIIAGT
jgi:hypothetical protein